YDRLCAYWHPFRQADNTFEANTSFDTVWQRYRFDRQLRLAVMDAIERVEVATRTALVHDIAMRSGAFGHLQHKNFPYASQEQHAEFISKLRQEAQRSSETFVAHF